MNYYIGIDLGTSSVKTLIMSVDGNITALSQKDYDFDKPYYNFAEQDVNVWRESTVFTIKDSLNQLRKIDSNYKISGISFVIVYIIIFKLNEVLYWVKRLYKKYSRLS